MASNTNEVVLVDFWANGFGMRVRIALDEKGIKYQYKEENLDHPRRSLLVLEMNPVQKSVPILIHEGRPVCDSSVILEYIDEMWTDGYPLLLPKCSSEKATARFWVNFIDNKLFRTQAKFLKSKGEAIEEAKKELIGELKQLEEFLGDKTYFGGDNFGFLDAAFIPFSSMFYGYESHGNFELEVECSKLVAWVKRCMEKDGVSRNLADPLEMYELHKQWYGIE